MARKLKRPRDSQARKAQASLAELRQRASEARASTMEELGAIVHRYKGIFADLAAQRAQVLHSLRLSDAAAAQLLDEMAIFQIYVPKCAVFDVDDITITYVPSEEMVSSESFEDTDVEQQIASPTKKSQPVDAEPEACQYEQTSPKPPSRDTTKPRPVEIQTQSRDIKMADVSRSSFWIFKYGPDTRRNFFVMKCPQNCQSPVFTKHPLIEGRAADHFRRCKVPFKNERDMIQRYAHQVVSGRRGREVTRSWARKQNSRLIPENESHLHAENFSDD